MQVKVDTVQELKMISLRIGSLLTGDLYDI